MTGDVFIEYMIRRQPDAKQFMTKLGIGVAAIVVPMVLMFVVGAFEQLSFLRSLIPFFFLGSLWGGCTLLKRQNLEFEYIVTNGILDVDKIIAKSARKRLVSIDCRSMEILAPVCSCWDQYKGQQFGAEVEATTSPQSPHRWFAVFNDKSGKRTVLFFEPNEKMLAAFKPLMSRKFVSP